MDYFKKGTLVFVHTEKYPPWPATIDRRYDNGQYKVSFLGQKTYTRIQPENMDIFTEQRAKQIQNQLWQDKKLIKAIYKASKQFEQQKKSGTLDQGFLQYIKKHNSPLDLSMYCDVAKLQSSSKPNPFGQFTSHSFAKYLPSNSSQDNLQQIGKVLDKIYEYIVLPVEEKAPLKIQQPDTPESKRIKIQQQIYKLKQLFLKQQQNFKPSSTTNIGTSNNKESSQKQLTFVGNNNKVYQQNIPQQQHHYEKETYHPHSYQPGTRIQNVESGSKTYLLEKLIDTKIIQKMIMTMKAYDTFREQSEQQLEETMNLLKEKFNMFYDKFRQELNKKRIPSHKDRIMLEKFQNFQAYL